VLACQQITSNISVSLDSEKMFERAQQYFELLKLSTEVGCASRGGEGKEKRERRRGKRVDRKRGDGRGKGESRRPKRGARKESDRGCGCCVSCVVCRVSCVGIPSPSSNGDCYCGVGGVVFAPLLIVGSPTVLHEECDVRDTRTI
jgi:hypothetical protein